MPYPISRVWDHCLSRVWDHCPLQTLLFLGVGSRVVCSVWFRGTRFSDLMRCSRVKHRRWPHSFCSRIASREDLQESHSLGVENKGFRFSLKPRSQRTVSRVDSTPTPYPCDRCRALLPAGVLQSMDGTKTGAMHWLQQVLCTRGRGVHAKDGVAVQDGWMIEI